MQNDSHTEPRLWTVGKNTRYTQQTHPTGRQPRDESKVCRWTGTLAVGGKNPHKLLSYFSLLNTPFLVTGGWEGGKEWGGGGMPSQSANWMLQNNWEAARAGCNSWGPSPIEKRFLCTHKVCAHGFVQFVAHIIWTVLKYSGHILCKYRSIRSLCHLCLYFSSVTSVILFFGVSAVNIYTAFSNSMFFFSMPKSLVELGVSLFTKIIFIWKQIFVLFFQNIFLERIRYI
jgi:hypothetical protein